MKYHCLMEIYTVVCLIIVAAEASRTRDEVKIVVKLKPAKKSQDAQPPHQRNKYAPSAVQDYSGVSSITANQIISPPFSSQENYKPPPFYYFNTNHLLPQLSYKSNVKDPTMGNYKTVKITKTITPVVTRTITYGTHHEHSLSTGYHHQSPTPEKSTFTPVPFHTYISSFSDLTSGLYGPVTFSDPPRAPSQLNRQHKYHTPLMIDSDYQKNHASQQASIDPGALTATVPHSSSGPGDSYASHSSDNYSSAMKSTLPFQGQSFRAPRKSYPNILRIPSSPPYYSQTTAESRNRHHQFCNIKKPHDHRQPVMTFVQTYAAPSVTVTKYLPLNNAKKD